MRVLRGKRFRARKSEIRATYGTIRKQEEDEQVSILLLYIIESQAFHFLYTCTSKDDKAEMYSDMLSFLETAIRNKDD